MVFSFDSFPWLSPLKHTQTHTHIYRSNAAHATTYKYDGRIENDRDGCHRGVRHDRVFSFPREWKGTAKVRRSGVFGNVRRRTQRMGEIGSRAIHRCVVVFLSLSLVGRTIRARVCVGFKALVVSRLKEIRARETREKGLRGNANSDRLGKSDRIIIVSFSAAKNTFCSRALQYISVTKRGKKRR